jgi:hypothetical protein
MIMDPRLGILPDSFRAKAVEFLELYEVWDTNFRVGYEEGFQGFELVWGRGGTASSSVRMTWWDPAHSQRWYVVAMGLPFDHVRSETNEPFWLDEGLQKHIRSLDRWLTVQSRYMPAMDSPGAEQREEHLTYLANWKAALLFGHTLMGSTWRRCWGVCWTGCDVDAPVVEEEWKQAWDHVLEVTKDMDLADLTKLVYSTWPIQSVSRGDIDMVTMANEYKAHLCEVAM